MMIFDEETPNKSSVETENIRASSGIFSADGADFPDSQFLIVLQLTFNLLARNV